MYTTHLRTCSVAVFSGLIGLLVFFGLSRASPTAAQPLTFVSPQQVPPAFLSVPYYGSEQVNSYFDHDYPTYWVNGTIEIYNGWTATNAVTCTTTAYRHVSSGTCLYYDGHPGYDLRYSEE